MVNGQETPPGAQPGQGYGGTGGPGGQMPPAQPPMYAPPPRRKGFWSRLFDLSFEEFVTPSLIKLIFVVAMIVIALGILGAIVVGFMTGVGTGFIMLVGSLIWGFFALLWIRVLLEVAIVFFRIRDDTEEMVARKR